MRFRAMIDRAFGALPLKGGRQRGDTFATAQQVEGILFWTVVVPLLQPGFDGRIVAMWADRAVAFPSVP